MVRLPWGFLFKNNFGVVLKLYNATCICMVAYTLKPVCLLMKKDPKTLLSGGFCLWYLTQGKTENLGIVINCLTQYCRAEEQQQKLADLYTDKQKKSEKIIRTLIRLTKTQPNDPKERPKLIKLETKGEKSLQIPGQSRGSQEIMFENLHIKIEKFSKLGFSVTVIKHYQQQQGGGVLFGSHFQVKFIILLREVKVGAQTRTLSRDHR